MSDQCLRVMALLANIIVSGMIEDSEYAGEIKNITAPAEVEECTRELVHPSEYY